MSTHSPDSFEALQLALSAQLHIPIGPSGYYPTPNALIFTADIQYIGDKAFVAIDVCEWEGELRSIFLSQEVCTVPYQPGFFAFREGPVLESTLEKIAQQHQLSPDLLLVDGHGTAHPRKMGLASWIGVRQGVPTIGVAKDSLLSETGLPDETAGSSQPILLDEETVGHALRTQNGVKPVYVSSGHLISQVHAVQVAYALRSDYRIIEPIRRADQAAREFARGGIPPGVTYL